MQLRAAATLKDVQTPTVSEALRRNARPIILLSIFLGAATFVAMSLFAPSAHLTVATKAGLAALMGLASLMFGSAAVVMATLFTASSPRRLPKKKMSGKRRKGPLVTALPDEPLLREMPTGQHVSEPSGVMGTQLPSAPRYAIYDNIEALGARVASKRFSGGGHRTLVTSETESLVPFSEAVELARLLADSGAQTILVDWSPSGNGFGRLAALKIKTGWNELMRRTARFDEIIQQLPGTRAHVIASGGAMPSTATDLDASFLNVALDALDEAYDHIVVVGRHDEARALFECIEGRFDTGITVVSPDDTGAAQDSDNAFLGFEVADIDLLRYLQPAEAASPLSDRIARATRQKETVIRRG